MHKCAGATRRSPRVGCRVRLRLTRRAAAVRPGKIARQRAGPPRAGAARGVHGRRFAAWTPRRSLDRHALARGEGCPLGIARGGDDASRCVAGEARRRRRARHEGRELAGARRHQAGFAPAQTAGRALGPERAKRQHGAAAVGRAFGIGAGAQLLSGLEVTRLERERLVFAARENPASRAAVDARRFARARHQGVELVGTGPVQSLFALAAALPRVAEATGRWIGAERRAQALAALTRDAARFRRSSAARAAALACGTAAGHGTTGRAPVTPFASGTDAAARLTRRVRAVAAEARGALVGPAGHDREQKGGRDPARTSNQYLWSRSDRDRAISQVALGVTRSGALHTGTQATGIPAEMALASVR